MPSRTKPRGRFPSELALGVRPDEEHVVGGAPPAFVVEVEKRADELVRAAEAFYLDGSAYQGEGPKGNDAFVPGGMFSYLVLPRHECVYLRRVTYW